jgi:Domain of unknown function (DUF1772)
MTLTLWRFAALLLTALLMGLTFAHVLEMPVKLRLDGPTWLNLQHTLYPYFALIGGPIELLAILASVVLAYLGRGQPNFPLTLAAAVLLMASFFGLWLGLVSPANARTAEWTAQTLPPDWAVWRARWEWGHAGSFVLQLAAFCLLLVSVFKAR